LAIGVLCTLLFGLATAGRSLEDLTERGQGAPATTAQEEMPQ
jgi:putative MFS transporter